jgi:hypothetical protein
MSDPLLATLALPLEGGEQNIPKVGYPVLGMVLLSPFEGESERSEQGVRNQYVIVFQHLGTGTPPHFLNFL